MTDNPSATTGGDAFARLQAAYAQRLDAARQARRQGHKVVGYVGNTVPLELIVAAGCHPVRIAPLAGATPLADPYVESFSDPDMRLTFQGYCSGDYEVLDLLVIARSTESQHKLYLSLREARRTGIVSAGPELVLYDILHTQRASSQRYGLARTHELLQSLAALGARAVGESDLEQAIASTNHTRRLLQTLQERRQTRAISGREALIASAATRFLAPLDAQSTLQDWLDQDQHTVCGGPRLLLKGCAVDHAELHAQVEAAGGCIVIEDDDWGSRAGEPLIATDRAPLQAIFEYHWRDVPCVRRHPDDGSAWFTRALASAAVDGVLFYLPPPDDIHGWTFPADRDRAERAGLPWLLIRQDAREPGDLPTQLAAFIEGLRQRSAARQSSTA